MGMFNWAAPMFNVFANRWSAATIDDIVEWLEPFLGREELRKDHLLDVGGGTGALAGRLNSATGARITVLDPTPQMLSYVPQSHEITGILGVAEEMPLPSNEFDAVIVTDAFHHFRDQRAAAREFQRVTRCGGGVVVVDLDPRPWFMRLIVRGEKLLGEPGAFFTPDEMCAFMAENGIDGSCTTIKGPSYRFTGTVREQ